MADEVTTPAVDPTPDPAPVAPDATPAPTTSTDLDSVDKLPKWAQKLIGDLRQESAGHRKAKTEAEKANEEAARKAAEEQGKFKELYELEMSKAQAAEARAKAAELSGVKARIGAKLALPAELMDRLRGETEEEIEADARTILAVIPRPAAITATDAGQGVNSTTPTAQKSDAEIREEAARFGVTFEALKAQYAR
jgi:hypothetical protein